MVKLILDIVSGKWKIEDLKNRSLYSVIKIADVLFNEDLEKKCRQLLLTRLFPERFYGTFLENICLRYISGLVFVPGKDGKEFLLSGVIHIKREIIHWTLEGGKYKSQEPIEVDFDFLKDLVFVPGKGGDEFLSYGQKGEIIHCTWNLKGGKYEGKRLEKINSDSIKGLVFVSGKGGEEFLSYGRTGKREEIIHWTLKDGKYESEKLEGNFDFIDGLVFVPGKGGKEFLSYGSTGEKGEIIHWTLKDGKYKGEKLEGNFDWIKGLVFVPGNGGKEFLSYGKSGKKGEIIHWTLEGEKYKGERLKDVDFDSIKGLVLVPGKGGKEFLSYGGTGKKREIIHWTWNFKGGKYEGKHLENIYLNSIKGLVLVPGKGGKEFLSYGRFRRKEEIIHWKDIFKMAKDLLLDPFILFCEAKGQGDRGRTLKIVKGSNTHEAFKDIPEDLKDVIRNHVLLQARVAPVEKFQKIKKDLDVEKSIAKMPEKKVVEPEDDEEEEEGEEEVYSEKFQPTKTPLKMRKKATLKDFGDI